MNPCHAEATLPPRCHVADVFLDPEFQGLLPPPLADEQALLEEALLRDGCREPLLVWRWSDRRILLIGYELIPLLRLHHLAFPVVEHTFGSREAARLFVLKHQVARRGLTPLATSYLRGLCYRAAKHGHGGDRRSAGPRAWPRGPGKTAQALAEVFAVDAATICRDGAVAAAVEELVAHGGADVKPLLLGRQARLTRGQLLALAAEPPHRQRDLLFELRLHGRLPRSWRSQGACPTITLPRDPAALLAALRRRLGEAWLAVFCRLAQESLEGRGSDE